MEQWMYESDIACWPRGREDSRVTLGLWHEFHLNICRMSRRMNQGDRGLEMTKYIILGI